MYLADNQKASNTINHLLLELKQTTPYFIVARLLNSLNSQLKLNDQSQLQGFVDHLLEELPLINRIALSHEMSNLYPEMTNPQINLVLDNDRYKEQLDIANYQIMIIACNTAATLLSSYATFHPRNLKLVRAAAAKEGGFAKYVETALETYKSQSNSVLSTTTEYTPELTNINSDFHVIMSGLLEQKSPQAKHLGYVEAKSTAYAENPLTLFFHNIPKSEVFFEFIIYMYEIKELLIKKGHDVDLVNQFVETNEALECLNSFNSSLVEEALQRAALYLQCPAILPKKTLNTIQNSTYTTVTDEERKTAPRVLVGKLPTRGIVGVIKSLFSR